MPFASVRNIDVYYEISGKGPKLLYISGTGADLRNRPNILDSPLVEQFEILAFDQRGLGQTDRPDIAYSMEDYANDAAELMHLLGWSPCHVVGLSFGGMVAQELALRHPEKIDRLVLCCTSSGGRGGRSYPLHEIPEMPDDELNSLSTSINDVRRDVEWQRKNTDEYQAILDFNNSRHAGDGEPGREIGAKRQLEARIGHDTYDRLSNIKHPTYIAGGAYDGIAPPANLKAIQEKINHSKLEFFQGGHGFLDQDPLAYQGITKFLLGES